MSARSPKVLVTAGLPIVWMSAWLSMIRHAVPSGLMLGGHGVQDVIASTSSDFFVSLQEMTTIGYLPIIQAPAHELDTLTTVIKRCNVSLLQVALKTKKRCNVLLTKQKSWVV